MKIVFSLIAFVLLLTNCDQPAPSASTTPAAEVPANISEEPAASASLENYALTEIADSKLQMATRNDANGMAIESGPIENGVKTGTWTENHPGTPYPAKVISYVDGKYNGVYLEMNTNGQIVLMANYKNNILHGTWAKMRFGKAEISVTYNEGKYEGLYKEFDFKNGKIKKEVMYKNGKEDGPMKFYNEQEEVTVEYLYRNGEKVSGGIVKK